MNYTRLRQLLGVCVLLSLFLLGQHLYWNVYYPLRRPNPPGMAPDIFLTILGYYASPANLTALWNDLIFGRGLQGSSIYIRYVFYLMFAFPVVKIVQDRFLKKYGITVLWVNWPYVVAAEAFTWIAMTTNGIAQAEGWYHNPVYQAPGNFDVATHFLAVGVIDIWVLSLAFAAWFALVPRLGDKHSQLFDIACTGAFSYIVMVFFEWMEVTNPDRYGNLHGNSLGDIAAGIAALFFIVFLYWQLVPSEIRGYESEVPSLR